MPRPNAQPPTLGRRVKGAGALWLRSAGGRPPRRRDLTLLGAAASRLRITGSALAPPPHAVIIRRIGISVHVRRTVILTSSCFQYTTHASCCNMKP